MTNTNVGLPQAAKTGRSAVYWSWYCSPRRADFTGRNYGKNGIGHKAYNAETATFGDYPGWKVMVSHPNQPYGVAGGRRGANRKVHMVRDQIVAKHRWHPEQRMTRWLCNAYTFDGILQPTATVVCSGCLMRAQGRTTEPLEKK